jgi:hypothetical protein
MKDVTVTAFISKSDDRIVRIPELVSGKPILGERGYRPQIGDKIRLVIKLPAATLERRAVVYVERRRDELHVIEKKRIRSDDETVAEFGITASCTKPTVWSAGMVKGGVFIDQNQGQARVLEVVDGRLEILEIAVVVQHGVPFFISQEQAPKELSWDTDEETGKPQFRCAALEERENGIGGFYELLEYLDTRFAPQLASVPAFDGHFTPEVTDEDFAAHVLPGQGRVRAFSPTRGTGSIVYRHPEGRLELVKLYYGNIKAERGTFASFDAGDVVMVGSLRPVNTTRKTSFEHEAVDVRKAG